MDLAESYLEVQERQSPGGIRDVFVGSDNITNFTRPQHLYHASASPSSRYLLVWHMDYSPRKVSVYDLTTKRKLKTFSPGAGGRLRWAAHDLIYHEWGAGTNTACWEVYGPDGRQRWQGGASGAELCRSGRYVIAYPSLPADPQGILVADVRNGAVIGSARPEGIARVVAHTWLDGRTMRFWYEPIEGPTRTVDVPLTPETPVPWASAQHSTGL